MLILFCALFFCGSLEEKAKRKPPFLVLAPNPGDFSRQRDQHRQNTTPPLQEEAMALTGFDANPVWTSDQRTPLQQQEVLATDEGASIKGFRDFLQNFVLDNIYLYRYISSSLSTKQLQAPLLQTMSTSPLHQYEWFEIGNVCCSNYGLSSTTWKFCLIM